MAENNEILFSIITAVYNNEVLVKSAIQSVLNQSYKNFEYIIVDDGSTDRTPEILDDIAKSDERIKVIHQKNQWIFASFNTGILNSEGEYVFIVNSDDTMTPGTLERVAKVAKKYNPDIIFSQITQHLCDEEQNIIKEDLNGYSKMVLKEEFLSNQDEFHNKWIDLIKKRYVSNNINFYKRSLAERHLYRNDNYMGDRFFNNEIARYAKTAYILGDFICYNHFVYESERNASRKYYDYSHIIGNEIYEDFKSMLEEWNIDSEENIRSVCEKRIEDLTYEYRLLKAANCPLGENEKIAYMISGSLDDTVMECVERTGDFENLQARILSGIREMLLIEELKKEDSMYFVQKMLESLLRYEKDEDDYLYIKNGVYNEKNPYKIGEVFYKKLVN
ncbi:MAG: glycosyltransferase family 2 protein [Pseudobutyrivibrio sp.]|nr:glycosyltransferase family 2 protein [Pseudobutyrivibrio sp.]